VAPLPDELVVDKYGYGSFHNTLLEDALRAARANQVWVVGTVTQICVEETVREGFRRGFEMVVAADGVSSFDDELHRATLRNLAQKFALVSDTVALMKTLTDTPRAAGMPSSPRADEMVDEYRDV
jgi:ureidoacrylate peracid hydrolase